MIIKSPIPKKEIQRPSKDLIKRLEGIGSATASSELRRLGVRYSVISGVTSWVPGKSIVGPAITLQYLPKREDQYLTTWLRDANHLAEPALQVRE